MPKDSGQSSNLQIDFPLSLLPRNVSIRSVLANGMFSTVYKAVYKTKTSDPNECPRELPFVVKHIKSSNHPKRVLTEMCLLSKLRGRHHNIPVWSLVSNNFSYLVVMPYFTHDSFSSFFRDLTRREIANYMYALLDALAYIHHLNVTHRDIKPTNFLYNRRTKSFALIDFGLAEKESRSCIAFQRQTSTSSKRHEVDASEKARSLVGSGEKIIDHSPMSKCAAPPSSDLKPLDPDKKATHSLRIDVNVIGPSPRKSILSPPGDNSRLFAIGRVIAGLTKPKSKLSASTIRRRLRFSDVMAADKIVSPKGPEPDATNDISEAKPTGHSKKNEGNLPSRRKSSDATGHACHCDVPLVICGSCQRAPEIQAQRSGTTGYRAPEVLLRSRSQTTAIDVWAAGVVFLIILTGRYPFFTAKVDLEAVCQLLSIFGKRKMAELASELGLVLHLPASCPYPDEAPLTLGDLCRKLRAGVSARRLFGPKPDEASQSRKRTLAQADVTPSLVLLGDVTGAEDIKDFTRLAFDLLEKLLEVRPSHRLSAEYALKHDFFDKFRQETGR